MSFILPSLKDVVVYANSVRRELGHTQSANLKKYTTKNPFAHRQINGFVQAILREINNIRPKPENILDLGCGEGVISAYSGHKIVGLDLSLPALQIAKKINKDSDFLCGSGEHLPYRTASFDLILCLEMLEHVPDPNLLLQELGRVLTSPYGIVIVTVPFSTVYRTLNLIRLKNVRRLGEDEDHIGRFSPRSFRKILSHHFASVQIKHAIPWLIGIGAKC